MSSQRKAIALNTTSYYLINFSDYIISLILLPFLARTILIEGVGILGLAQTLGIVCVLIMEFGFSLSATREIASSDNNENHSLVVSRVISSKIFLILPCLALCLLTFFNGAVCPLAYMLGFGTRMCLATLGQRDVSQGTARWPRLTCKNSYFQSAGLES